MRVVNGRHTMCFNTEWTQNLESILDKGPWETKVKSVPVEAKGSQYVNVWKG